MVIIFSHWETGPLVAWEAMAHGAVLVTSRYVGSGLEGSLRDGENCLMYPVGDMASAADCLARLKDPRLRCNSPPPLPRWCKRDTAMTLLRLSGARLSRRSARCPSARSGDLRRGALDALVVPAGRLDRLLGKSIAETLREILGASGTAMSNLVASGPTRSGQLATRRYFGVSRKN